MPLSRIPYQNRLGAIYLPATRFDRTARVFRSLEAEGDLAMPDRMAERRNSPRYPLILTAEVTELSSGANLHARTSDVSRTGCYIDTLNPAPAGTDIRLRLKLEQEVFDTQARVRYVSPGLGMGVMFQDTAPDQLAILDRWLADASRDA